MSSSRSSSLSSTPWTWTLCRPNTPGAGRHGRSFPSRLRPQPVGVEGVVPHEQGEVPADHERVGRGQVPQHGLDREAAALFVRGEGQEGVGVAGKDPRAAHPVHAVLARLVALAEVSPKAIAAPVSTDTSSTAFISCAMSRAEFSSQPSP